MNSVQNKFCLSWHTSQWLSCSLSLLCSPDVVCVLVCSLVFLCFTVPDIWAAESSWRRWPVQPFPHQTLDRKVREVGCRLEVVLRHPCVPNTLNRETRGIWKLVVTHMPTYTHPSMHTCVHALANNTFWNEIVFLRSSFEAQLAGVLHWKWGLTLVISNQLSLFSVNKLHDWYSTYLNTCHLFLDTLLSPPPEFMEIVPAAFSLSMVGCFDRAVVVCICSVNQRMKL